MAAEKDGAPRILRYMSEHLGWHSRDYLPHFDEPGLVQAITFRLADALPVAVLERWQSELADEPDRIKERFMRQRIEDWIDAGHGSCALRDARVAQMVEEALFHFDGQRYRLLAWVVMPNHMHLLIETLKGWPIAGLVHSWKTWTAHRANALRGTTGAFWQREYYDRYIRDQEHLANVVQYIEQNPVKAGLCASAKDWPWSSAKR